MKNRKAYDSIYAYDFQTNTWHYDCKYYLEGDWWCNEIGRDKGGKAFPLDKYHIRRMEQIIKENPEDFKGTKEVVQWAERRAECD